MKVLKGAILSLLFFSPLMAVTAGATSLGTPTEAIFVANAGDDFVTVYSLGSKGNVSPIATIGGAPILNGPASIASDAKGNIYVLTPFYPGAPNTLEDFVVFPPAPPTEETIVAMFSAGSTGNVHPVRVIGGPQSGLHGGKAIAVDSDANIYVWSYDPEPAGVRFFPANSHGDVPSATFGLGALNVDGIAIDPKGALLLANNGGDPEHSGVLVFTGGNQVGPTRTISGPTTGITAPISVALDSKRQIYVANYGGDAADSNIEVFPADSNGNVAPITTISGPNTGLNGCNPSAIALDSKDNIYVTTIAPDTITSSITVFAAGANGDATPMAVISGYKTKLSAATGIAIGPCYGTH